MNHGLGVSDPLHDHGIAKVGNPEQDSQDDLEPRILAFDCKDGLRPSDANVQQEVEDDNGLPFVHVPIIQFYCQQFLNNTQKIKQYSQLFYLKELHLLDVPVLHLELILEQLHRELDGSNPLREDRIANVGGSKQGLQDDLEPPILAIERGDGLRLANADVQQEVEEAAVDDEGSPSTHHTTCCRQHP